VSNFVLKSSKVVSFWGSAPRPPAVKGFSPRPPLPLAAGDSALDPLLKFLDPPLAPICYLFNDSKIGVPVKCLAQGHEKRTCRHLHIIPLLNIK